jgi:CMP-N-acetylneuraminic acid synthetase
MKLTEKDIKTTIDQFKSTTTDIHISTQACQHNTVEMRYNTNFKVFTIKHNGVPHYASNRKQALVTFYNQLYSL